MTEGSLPVNGVNLIVVSRSYTCREILPAITSVAKAFYHN